ncbi:MAG: hypothetical protein JWR00_709 [Rubritepida sp.]|nr:hypothetical protein [Rubritepida sp.]
MVVETPGTAPGSVTVIPRNVYRHSRKRQVSYSDAGAPMREGVAAESPA